MTGKKLKEMLNKLGMTQRSLAEKMNLTPQTISAILSANDIRTSTIERIAAVTDMPVSYWYDETKAFVNDKYEEEQVDSLDTNNGIIDVGRQEIKRVNIGKIIKEKVVAKGMTQAQFARLTGMQRQNVNKTVFDKSSIDSNLLCVISEILDCNFFKYYQSDKTDNTKEPKKTITAEVYEALREIRKKKAISQQVIADALNVDVAVVSNIEKGKRDLRVKELEIISNVLDVPIIDLFLYPQTYMKASYMEEDDVEAVLQIKLRKKQKDQILKLVFGENNIEILNR